MKIENCLILSAGLGTRMGEIGKVIPKPLWPLFDKKILDFQISQAKKIGCSKVIINTHHGSQFIEEHIRKEYHDDKCIEVIFEPELLDVGGTMINIAQKFSGKLLAINCDIIFSNISLVLDSISEEMEKSEVILFSTPVERDSLYNRLETLNGSLVKISKDPECRITYAGVSIVDLDKIPKCISPIKKEKFFTNVANPELKKVTVCPMPNCIDYFDVGTRDLYFENMFKILFNSIYFKGELISLGHIRDDKINYEQSNYGLAFGFRVINLSGKKTNGQNSIIFPETKNQNNLLNSIAFRNIVEQIN